MKILIAGEWCWYWYEEACANALSELGHTVIKYDWIHKFKKFIPNKVEPKYLSFYTRFQFRFLFGPTIFKINRGLVSKAEREKPDIIFLYNAQIIYPSTIKSIKKIMPEVIFIQYAQDNPFSNVEKRNIWRYFIKNIPYIDCHFTVRKINLLEYKKLNASNVFLMPQFFIPEYDYPIKLENINKEYNCDVVFAGHYENDGRVELLESICNKGYKLNLFGGGWAIALKSLDENSPLRKLYPIYPVVDEEYRQAICGAKVALCFFSTRNQDNYTTRNFQIPAMKTVMLSQYSKDLADLYIEGKEACFFSSKEELLDKLTTLLSDNELRINIAEAGYKRVYQDEHHVKGRMKKLMSDLASIHKFLI